ncbi:MAG: hypothetical protein H7318_15295 [Oligoflexus sp.]|nr:hypothetical protein [Oligoflexus sp.]
MKLLHYTKISAKALCLAVLLTACAGGEAPEEAVNGENANNAENGNEAGLNENSANSNENLNGNNASNNENLGNNGNDLLNNENLGANEGAPQQANEFVNNATGENFIGGINPSVPANGEPGDLAATQNSTEDLGIKSADGIVVGNQDTGANVAQPNANMGAIDTSLAPGKVAPATSGGRVRYVLKSGTNAYDQPNGKVVKNFEQGDHTVVSADGEWVRTSDGTFVSSSAITTRPVPRAKSVKSWH